MLRKSEFTMTLWGLSLALFIAVAGMPGDAMAAPVALIIDISGAADNSVEPFTEVEAGTQIDLGKDGRLEFLDYNSCKNVIISGGRLAFTDKRYSLRGGKVMKEARGRCPKVMALDKNARVGGVRLRSSANSLRLNDKPSFAFTGHQVTRIRILSKGNEVLSVTLQEPQFQWPSRAEGLAHGSYVLEIQGKNGSPLKQVPFQVTKQGGKSPLTIVRLN